MTDGIALTDYRVLRGVAVEAPRRIIPFLFGVEDRPPLR
jgi:hypothetical protein